MGGFLSWLRVQWDRTAAVAAGVIGLLVLVLGWVGVSGTPHIAEQLPYFISGGLIGLFFLGLAVALWLSADLRDEWRRLDDIYHVMIEQQADDSSAGPERDVRSEAGRPADGPRRTATRHDAPAETVSRG